MKQLVNFRFDQDVLSSLKALEGMLHQSKTQIVEEAILRYADEKKVRRSKLLALAGSLSNDEANTMLKVIHESKNRKEMMGIL